MRRYTRSIYGTSARNTNKLNEQTVCDFCSYGCHARRYCVLRKQMTGEIVALSNTFFKRKHELSHKIRPQHFQQKQTQNNTNIEQQSERHQQFNNIHRMDIQQQSIDTKTELMKNNFMPKSPRFVNNAILNEHQKFCANSSKANVFSPSPAEVQKITSFYQIYLARNQPEKQLKPLEQNSLCAKEQSTAPVAERCESLGGHDLSADLHSLFNDSTKIGNKLDLACAASQSEAQVIELCECFESQDLSADLHSLFSDLTEIGNERDSACAAEQSEAQVAEKCEGLGSYDLSTDLHLLFNGSTQTKNEPKSTQSDGQKIVHIDVSGARGTKIIKMTSPLTVISREVSVNFNFSTHKNSPSFAQLITSHFIFYLTHNFESNFSNEATATRIYSSRFQPNWKTRKRGIGNTFFHQFMRIDDNQFSHSSRTIESLCY